MEKRLLGLFVAISILSACSSSLPEAAKPEPIATYDCAGGVEPHNLGIITTDYQVGLLQFFDLETKKLRSDKIPVHSDALIRTFPGDRCFYVVNRDGGDNIQVVDPATMDTVAQLSVGRGTNATDVYVDGYSAWVTRYRSDHLVRLDLRNGQIEEFDLSGYADADGYPEMDRIYHQSGKLLIPLQRLDSERYHEPTDYSTYVIWDLASQQVVADHQYAFTNPYGEMKSGPGPYFYQALVGSLVLPEPDGGIQRIQSESLEPAGLVVTEEQLGGQIVDFAFLGDRLFILRMPALAEKTKVQLVEWDGARNIAKLIHEKEGYSLVELNVVRGELWVTDRSAQASGVLRVGTSDNQLDWMIKGLILPPFKLAGWEL